MRASLKNIGSNSGWNARCGRMRLMTTGLRKSAAPSSSATNNSPMPPVAMRPSSAYRPSLGAGICLMPGFPRIRRFHARGCAAHP